MFAEKLQIKINSEKNNNFLYMLDQINMLIVPRDVNRAL